LLEAGCYPKLAMGATGVEPAGNLPLVDPLLDKEAGPSILCFSLHGQALPSFFSVLAYDC